MKNTRELSRMAAAATAWLVATACSGGGDDDRGALNKNVPEAPAAVGGAPVTPEPGGAAAAAIDGTPEPPEDPGHVVGAVVVPTSVERGKTVTLTFRTRPGSSCQVEMRLASTKDDGGVRLPAAVANDAGLVSWAWNVSSDANTGPATAFVVCSGGQRGQADLRVS